MFQNIQKFTIINHFLNLNTFTVIIVDSLILILILFNYLRNKLITTEKIINEKKGLPIFGALGNQFHKARATVAVRT